MRGALSVGLAYALLLQLVVAGLAFERSSTISMAADANSGILCVRGVDGPSQTPVAPQADHSVCCALCAFHSLAPLLPDVAGAGTPLASDGEAGPQPVASIETSGQYRREPRSSQGPPPAT